MKAGFIDGAAVDAKSIDELAKLPPKEVLVAQVLGGLNGPIQGFANVAQRRHPRPGYRPQRHCREAERVTALPRNAVSRRAAAWRSQGFP